MGLESLAARVPRGVRTPLKRLKDSVVALPYYGSGRFCPVCGKSSRRFRPFGVVPREDAQCAHCGALERHRLLWLYVSTRTNLFDGKPKKVLHVAPEPCFEPRFRQRLGSGYITADLFDPTAMVRMDIMDIDYADQSFDVIYCSHVLEHVRDDTRALREFHRVLRSDGWAILLVPITARETFEDPSITTPEGRLKAFGQHDHVRRYGPDYAGRLRDAGFRVDVAKAGDLVGDDEVLRMGLTPASGEIYFCTKG